MVLSDAAKRDAYREAQQILKLGDKWQELMPGERKPNFERAAQEILRRALGHAPRPAEEPLDVHGGMMHQHKPREARLIERTLRSGLVHPDVLHSFQSGIVTGDPKPPKPKYDLGYDPDLPDFEVFVHDAATTIDYPSHYEPGTDTYHSSVHDPEPYARELPMQQPDARLPSTYEAVH